MKKIILNFEAQADKYQELIQEALNNNLYDFLVSSETFYDFEGLSNLNIYSRDQNLKPNNLISYDEESLNNFIQDSSKSQKIGFYKKLHTKNDEELIISKKNNFDFVIVAATDWKIIPFENIISQIQGSKTQIFAEVKNIEEAELMLKVLEVGVDGILFKPTDAEQIHKLKKLTQQVQKIDISYAKVVKIQPISESERVCVDTSSLLDLGEGMLIGSTAKGFILVHGEIFDTKFVSSRPFRVNAGDVSAYIMVPSNDDDLYKTKYLSELKGGDQVYISNSQGYLRKVNVARVKIETRPMIRFELITKVKDSEIKLSVICQNAETIRLVKKDGDPISVVNVKLGDEVLVHIGPGATHFGTPLKENIIEK